MNVRAAPSPGDAANGVHRPFPQDVAPLICGLLAVALPMLIAPSVPPTATFFNQAAAVLGAGLWLLVLSLRRPPAGRGIDCGIGRGATILVAVLWALALAQVITGAPLGQRLVPLGMLLLGSVLAWASARAARAGDLGAFARPLMLSLMGVGLVSTAIAALQVFVPEVTGNALVAYPTVAGRAVGNMRQPNQLSTLLLWSMAATVWWGQHRRWRWDVVAALLAALTVGVLWTASRTGMVGVLMLAIWGLLDSRLPLKLRIVMVVALPLLYVVGWWGMEQWSQSTGRFFYGDDQVKKTLHGDPSSSRGRIWSDTLALIGRFPWTGVGAGAFNFVWSLTPFPHRPVAFFDHSHSLPMQLAVESGIPFAVGVLAALAAAFRAGRSGLWHPDPDHASGVRACWFALAVVGVHSLLEYPLWYGYFLLPACVMAGWACAGAAPPPRVDGPETAVISARRRPRVGMAVAGTLTVLGTVWAGLQYYTVATIFDPGLTWGEAPPLEQRIARGQRSVLFGHHADYARVTMAEHPETVFGDFDRTVYHLLDTRLMVAYARALAGRGELARARDVAARLREFHNPAADDFFAPCDERPLPQPRPFQCVGDDPGLPATQLRPRVVLERPGPAASATP